MVGGLRVLSEVLRAELGTGDQLPSNTLNNLMLALGTAVCGNSKSKNNINDNDNHPNLWEQIFGYKNNGLKTFQFRKMF